MIGWDMTDKKVIYFCDNCGEALETDKPEDFDGNHYCPACLKMMYGMEAQNEDSV